MQHLELSVKINPLSVELASEALISDAGCSGVVQQETYFDDEVITSDIKDIVKGYILLDTDKVIDKDDIQSKLWQKRAELIECGISEKSLGSWNVTFKNIQEEDWAHSWKKYWHPMKISNNIVICPSWETYEIKNNEMKIELDPGCAFGTGSHPTTRLCTVAIEKYIKSGDKVADIGMGSGILSIAALKLGAQSIIGVDNDDTVIEVAKDNARNNNVLEGCNFYEGSACDVNGKYNIVVANILAHILIDIMQDLVKLLDNGSKLILSGIIKEKTQDVIEAAKQFGLTDIEVMNEDNWVAIILENK